MLERFESRSAGWVGAGSAYYRYILVVFFRVTRRWRQWCSIVIGATTLFPINESLNEIKTPACVYFIVSFFFVIGDVSLSSPGFVCCPLLRNM